MFCTNCGNKVPEDMRFCPQCGTPIKNAAETQPFGNAQQQPLQAAPQGQAPTQPMQQPQGMGQPPYGAAAQPGVVNQVTPGNQPNGDKKLNPAIIVIIAASAIIVIAAIVLAVVFLGPSNSSTSGSAASQATTTKSATASSAGSTQSANGGSAVAGTGSASTGSASSASGSTVTINVVGADGSTRTAEIHRKGTTERVLPEGSTRRLSRSDISGLSDAEKCIAWNEIIAASNGYAFKNSGLANYFNGCSWYHRDPNASGSGNLSPDEQANVDLLKANTDSWWMSLATN